VNTVKDLVCHRIAMFVVNRCFAGGCRVSELHILGDLLFILGVKDL
jgi:hypothetical protein